MRAMVFLFVAGLMVQAIQLLRAFSPWYIGVSCSTGAVLCQRGSWVPGFRAGQAWCVTVLRHPKCSAISRAPSQALVTKWHRPLPRSQSRSSWIKAR